jgi:thiol-disulfide isomerase/thioredoxin
MRVPVVSFALAAVLAGCAQPSAAQGDDPAGLLSAAASTYREASNFQLKGTKIHEQHDEFVDYVVRTPFTLLLTSDNRFRQESMTEAGATIQVCDGEKHWNYSSQNNKYSSAAGTPNPVSLFNTAVDLRFLNTGLVEAKLLRQESVDAGGAQHFCDVIEARYERTRQTRNVELGDVEFWVDHESHRVWKTRMPVVAQAGALGKHVSYLETTVYSDVRMNLDLTPEAFAFTPPAGATEQKSTTVNAHDALVGRPAPDFKLRDLDGAETQLASLKGKAVLIDFWATWCGPCRMTMPKLNNLYKKFRKQEVVVMGIDENEDEQTVRDYIRKNRYEYPILLSPRGDATAESYFAHALPTLVLIDKNGVVADYKVGYGSETEDMLRDDLSRMLAADYVAPKPVSGGS